jgi:hypothetical protein
LYKLIDFFVSFAKGLHVNEEVKQEAHSRSLVRTAESDWLIADIHSMTRKRYHSLLFGQLFLVDMIAPRQ